MRRVSRADKNYINATFRHGLIRGMVQSVTTAQGDESIGGRWKGGVGGGAPLLNEAAMDRVTLQTRNGRWERKEEGQMDKYLHSRVAEGERERGGGRDGCSLQHQCTCPLA